MISVTQKDAEKALEEYRKESEMPTKLGGIIGSKLGPVLIAVIILLILLPIKLIYKFLILIGFILVIFLIPLVIIFIHYSAKIKHTYHGKNKLRYTLSALRNRKFFELFKNEICSDNLLNACDRVIASETLENYRISIMSVKCSMLSLRRRFTEAHEVLDEMRTVKADDAVRQNEIASAELLLSASEDRKEDFLNLLDKYEPWIEQIKNRDINGLISAALLVNTRDTFLGNYSEALESARIIRFLRDNQKQMSKDNQIKIPTTNYDVFQTASLSLAMAECFLGMGDIDSARSELDAADLEISALTCDIPDSYVYNHEKLIAEIGKE